MFVTFDCLIGSITEIQFVCKALRNSSHKLDKIVEKSSGFWLHIPYIKYFPLTLASQ